MLMSVYLGQQRWNLLEALLEQVKKTDPYDPAVWLVESQMWSARGDVARSVAALEQAATVAPRSPLVLRDYLQGLLAAGQYQKALDLAQQRMSPEMEPILKAVQGRALAKLNHPQEADHAFIDAVCKAPAGQLDWVLGQAVQTWGPKEATTQAQRWLQTKPEELMMYLAGGKLALVAGNAQAAEGLFGRGLALAKQPAQRVLLNRELALCYYQSRQLDQAQKTYLAVLQDDPNDLASLNNLSYLYTNDLNQPEKALPYIQKAVQQTPYNADILDTYGWTLAKLQRPREAEVFLSQAVQANSASALCRYHLGWVYEQTRRFADAQRQYQSAQAAMAGQPDPELGKTLSEALARMAAQTSS
jgi:Tfp pilus assembly protein PilF